MSEPLLDVLLGAIASQGLDYQSSRQQGGLRAIQRGRKLIVQRLNGHGLPVRLRAADRRFLEAFAHEFAPFSRLGAMFGYTETLRRRQAALGIAAREARGAIFGLESLDGKAPRMLKIEEIAEANPERLPRWYTFVTDNPPMRHVVWREWPFRGGAVRPDELAASWTITSAELDEVKNGTPFEQIRKTIAGASAPKNMRLVSADPNRPISGSPVVTHYRKNLAGGTEGLRTLLTKFKLQPVGTVVVEFREVYLEALAVIFRPQDDGWRAGTIRPASDSPVRRLVITTTATLRKVRREWTASLTHNASGIQDPKVAQRVAALATRSLEPLQRVLARTKALRLRK